MTRMHRETILQSYPQLAERARTVAPDGTDVSDPYGAGIEEYRRCCDQLEGYLVTFANSLVNAKPGDETS
jgi:protein-tyrosine-phosphatase